MEMQATGQPNYNSNYQKMDGDDSTQPWYILSIISWILFVISLWVAYDYEYYIWTPYTSLYNYLLKEEGGSFYYPIELETEIIKMPWLHVYFLSISVIGFAVYLIFTTYKKNKSLYDGMLGTLSRFHFIPLLFITGLYILSISGSYILSIYKDFDSVSREELIELFKSFRTIIIFNLIFTIIALGTLIVIYITTQLDSEWYIVLAIKKGVYSSFIILLLYNFFHIIVSFRLINYFWNILHRHYEDGDAFTNFFKRSGIAFTIVFGFLSLVFSVLFKDIMAAFTTFLIYLGMVISFFNKNKEQREIRKEEFNGYADGVLQIIYMALSLACIAFLIFWCKHKLF